jgi:nucleotide-binding universal stress UspA family protein
MPDSTPSTRKRKFTIFHPSDFTAASEVAFAHALKIALQSKAKLEIMHVEPHLEPERAYWTEYPAVRSTLARWGILPDGVSRNEVAKTGVLVQKALVGNADPLDSMMRHFRRSRPDLIVLATHQRQGLERWVHRAVAEPLARRSGAMTLFVPQNTRGFVNLTDGAINLQRALLPVDHEPDPQVAIDKASLLVQGLGCHSGEFRLLHVGPGKMPLLDLPRIGWAYQSALAQGDVVEEILKAEREWQADLIVLSTRGHLDFLDALRGSTTERVLRGAQCPVLAIPAKAAGASFPAAERST